MNEIIEVKEFDKIVSKSSDKEKYICIEENSFKKLKEFIANFNKDENDTDTDALKFCKIGYGRDVGDIITVQKYVGVIQVTPTFQLQILPKLDFDSEKDNESDNKTKDLEKKIFMRMIQALLKIEVKVFKHTSLKVEKMNIFEVFINMYAMEVDKLVKQGLKSNYVQKEDNLKFFKGKLKINEHIKKNMVHKERFYVQYDDFSINRAENRLIKSTLLKLLRISREINNVRLLKRLLSYFEMIEPSTNYMADFAKIRSDRSMLNYESIMEWSKVFLLNKSFTSFAGEVNSRALLFPMDKLFEAYIAMLVKKELNGLRDWKVYTQHKKHHLFDEPKMFLLKPDIVAINNEKCFVMDTKWKKLIDKKGYNYGISQADMYQMYAYAKKYNSKNIYVIYPKTHISNKEFGAGEFCFKTDNGIKIIPYFIDMLKAEESVKKLVKLLNEKITEPEKDEK